jgi:hypothetical protein
MLFVLDVPAEVHTQKEDLKRLNIFGTTESS